MPPVPGHAKSSMERTGKEYKEVDEFWSERIPLGCLYEPSLAAGSFNGSIWTRKRKGAARHARAISRVSPRRFLVTESDS